MIIFNDHSFHLIPSSSLLSQIIEVVVLISENFLKPVLNPLLPISLAYIRNPFLIRIVEKPQVVMEAFVDQTLISFEKIFPFVSVFSCDCVENSIIEA